MQLTFDEIRSTERAHYLMQLSSYFSELTDQPGIHYAYTHRFTDIWYNQAYDIQATDDEVCQRLEEAENYFSSRKRMPCIYVSPATNPRSISAALTQKGYGVFEKEAWMFSPVRTVQDYSIPAQIEVSQVKTEEDLRVFSDVYRRGLRGPEVEEYVAAVVDGLRHCPPLVSIWYYIARYRGEAAGMISLLKVAEYAGVYAVATLPQYQRKGIARAMNHVATENADKEGAKYLFLQTVAEKPSEEVFRKLGYRTLYCREGYATRESIEELQHG